MNFFHSDLFEDENEEVKGKIEQKFWMLILPLNVSFIRYACTFFLLVKNDDFCVLLCVCERTID